MDPEFAQVLKTLVFAYNCKIQAYLPPDHPLDELYHDHSLYYQKVPGQMLREQARALLDKHEAWPISKVLNFFRYTLTTMSDRTIIVTVLHFMMTRYHDIQESLDHMQQFRTWIEDGLLRGQLLSTFCEYCLLPLVNYSPQWLQTLQNWASAPHYLVRAAAGLAIKKCAIDKDKADFALELVLILSQQCQEKEVKAAMGQVMRQVGKKRKGVLRRFLDEHLAKIPRSVLRAGVARLSKTEQERYITAAAPSAVSTDSLVDESMFEDSLGAA